MKKYEEYAIKLAKFLTDDYNTKVKEKYKYLDKKIYRKINLPMASSCEDGVAYIISGVLNSKYNYLVDVHLKRKIINGERRNSYRPDIVIVNPNTNEDKIEIVGIIEVKAQMGYCPIYEPKDFKTKRDELEDCEADIEFSEEEMKMISNVSDLKKFLSSKLYLQEEEKCWKIKYTLAKDLKILVVNVLASNHESKVEKTIYNFDQEHECDNIYFYTLFGNIYENNKKIKVWYQNLDKKYIYENNTKNSAKKYKKNKKEISIYITQQERKNHGFERFIDDLQKFFN